MYNIYLLLYLIFLCKKYIIYLFKNYIYIYLYKDKNTYIYIYIYIKIYTDITIYI